MIKKYWPTIQKHYRYFYEHNIPVDIVGPDDDFSSYKLIIDPMHFLMFKNYMDKIHTYVKNGGVLVGTYISGIVDENVLAYMNEWPKQLQDIYGIEPLQTDVLYPSQSNSIAVGDTVGKAYDYCDILINHDAEELGKYQNDFYAGRPAVTKHKFEKGYGYYLGCRLDYAFLEEFYHNLVYKFNIEPEYPIELSSNKITIQVREDDMYRYYFVQNWERKINSIKLTEPLFDMLLDTELNNTEKIAPYETKVYRQKK